MKRFLLIFISLFAPVFASDQLCSVEICERTSGYECKLSGRSVLAGRLTGRQVLDTARAQAALLKRYQQKYPGESPICYEEQSDAYVATGYIYSDGRCSGYDPKNSSSDYRYIETTVRAFTIPEKEFIKYCSLPLPDLSNNDWCEEGLSSPIYIPKPSMLKVLNGRPVVRLSCESPPFDELIYYNSWDDYAFNKNPKSYEDLENLAEGGGGLGGEPGSGVGDPENPGTGQAVTTLEDVLQAVNFASANSTKSTIDAINFSSDAIARAVRDGIDSSSIGSDGSGGSGGSGSGSGSEGSGSDLEIPEGLLTEEYLDGLFAGFISDAQNIDDSEIDSTNVESIDISNLNKTYNVKLLASKQCPAPIPISFSMFGHTYNYYLTFDYLCMFAEVVGTLLLAAAYFSAAFIVARVARR